MLLVSMSLIALNGLFDEFVEKLSFFNEFVALLN